MQEQINIHKSIISTHEEKFKNLDNKIDTIEQHMEEKSKQRVQYIEEKIKVANNRILDLECITKDLSNISAAIAKLTLLSEQNIQANQERDKLLTYHNEHLIEMSSEIKMMARQNIDLSKNYENVRKDAQEIKTENTINIPTLIKYTIFTVTSMVLGAGISHVFFG